MTQAQLEHMTNQALAGQLHSPDVSKDKARETIEARVSGCMHATGCTPEALSRAEPARYGRWLEGNRKALVRAGLIASGDLSKPALERLKDRELRRRSGVDIDAINDDFDSMFDDGERGVTYEDFKRLAGADDS